MISGLLRIKSIDRVDPARTRESILNDAGASIE